jgi:DNA mismatch repair protein MutS
MTSDTIDSSNLSPMMAQWQTCKQQAPNALLLFRMGDFYEAFYEDAVMIAKELDLTLTRRQGIPMSGVPWHTCENYIDRLIAKGHRVAIAEQMEDPKQAKGIVRREIVRIVTPGTIVTSSLLSDSANNFIASFTQVGALFGLAFLDLTTAEFRVIEFDDKQDLINEIYRIHPTELLTSEKFHQKHRELFDEIRQSYSPLLNTLEDWRYEHQLTCDFLIQHFHVHNLDGFGLRGMVAAINAAGALLAYLKDSLSLSIAHIDQIATYSTAQFMSLDRITQRNLELTESFQEGSKKNTLLSTLDRSCTPMGGRLLRRWIKQPLLQTQPIRERQNALKTLLKQAHVMEALYSAFENVRDLERLMIRITTGYASPRDLVALKDSCNALPAIKELVQSLTDSALLNEQFERLEDLSPITTLIGRAIVDEPPLRISDGRVFRDGYQAELDELRAISSDSKTWIANYQTSLKESTGIKTLKVGFTRMFGYYIEVSKGQSEKMPSSFSRRQTLVNAERYITPELKDYENKVFSAEERMTAIESELFVQLRTEIASHSSKVMRVAAALAVVDVLNGLATVAQKQQYVCPTVDESGDIRILAGRHPVGEAGINLVNGKFIPNDTLLDSTANRLCLITGPNMAGKSTYIRQVALIAIMAQIGSFVPAQEAHIGIIDKVFTRIGASDDLARGQSTFMVEMTEAANILNHATSRSLVILDEIGRGTSTYDGISIAWSIAEYLLKTEGKMAKTLFATHYWELTKLEEKIPGAVNYNVAVQECDDQIIFLRKIVRGSTDKSYGIHVGRLAGLPPAVITRAKEILTHLEENANRRSAFESVLAQIPVRKAPSKQNPQQLLFF